MYIILTSLEKKKNINVNSVFHENAHETFKHCNSARMKMKMSTSRELVRMFCFDAQNPLLILLHIFMSTDGARLRIVICSAVGCYKNGGNGMGREGKAVKL